MNKDMCVAIEDGLINLRVGAIIMKDGKFLMAGNDFNTDYLYGEGCEVWLITSDFEAMKHIGLKPSRKIPLVNGSLDCRFLQFKLYEGSKKASKQDEDRS